MPPDSYVDWGAVHFYTPLNLSLIHISGFGKGILAVCLLVLLISFAAVIRLTKPVEYKRGSRQEVIPSRVLPISLRDANAFVLAHHRHSGQVRGCKFCVAVVDDLDAVHGVAIVGRPVARRLDDGKTAEVTRLCTDGIANGIFTSLQRTGCINGGRKKRRCNVPM